MSGGSGVRPADHGVALLLLAATLVTWGLGMVALMVRSAPPDAAQGPLLAVFAPGTPRDAMAAAVFRAGGGPVRETALPFVLVAAGPEPGFAGRLRRGGALAVLGDLAVAPALAGCAAPVRMVGRVPGG